MTTLTQELERGAHDIMTMPSMRDNIEIAIAGGALGAVLGYLKAHNTPNARAQAASYAMWGAGIGVAGQYMVFHMLKPAMKQFARSTQTAATIMSHPAFIGQQRSLVGAPWGRLGGGGHYPHGGFGHAPHLHQQHQPPCPPGMMYQPHQGCVPFGGP